MRIGAHLSIGAGLKRTADVAIHIGCEAVQIFSGNPNSWHTPPLSPELAREFADRFQQKSISPLVLHTPYLVNLAAINADILTRSRETVKDALRRALLLKARYVVTHVGSHKGAGVEAGIKTVIESVREIFEGEKFDSVLLFETSNGSGNSLGRSFEELAAILNGLKGFSNQIGVCLDTAHIWAAGYDLASPKGLESVLEEFDQKIGLDRLQVVHANDSSTMLGAHRDVHLAPGRGRIGLQPFEKILNDPRLQDKAVIMEMPRVSELDVEIYLREMKRLRKERQPRPTQRSGC